MSCNSHCIVGCDYQLAQGFPWTQQLETEINGKSVCDHGVALFTKRRRSCRGPPK